MFDDRGAIPINTTELDFQKGIQVLGYPGIGGATMTYTSGDYAGVVTNDGNEFYKTTASINPGNSGGAAFNGTFELIGIPTARLRSEVVCEGSNCYSATDSMGFIRPIRYAVPLIEQAKEASK